MNKPNPGSKEAVNQGCQCPVFDNHHGEGIPLSGDEPSFWIDRNCPLHAQSLIRSKMEKKI